MSSSKGTILRKVAGACGITSQFVALTTLLIAISSSHRFSWTGNDISYLGAEGSAATLFNWGLIIAGVLSLMFAIGLGMSLLSSRLGKCGVVNLLLGSMAMSAIGIFPRTINRPHDLATILFFVFIPMALLLIGIAAVTASPRRWGLLSLTAVVIIVVLMLVPWPWKGGAISQLLFCLPWSLWTIVFGVVLFMRAGPIDVQGTGSSTL